MSNVAEALQTPEALALSAMDHLTKKMINGRDAVLVSNAVLYIDQAGKHLEEALKRVPRSTEMSVENASEILRRICQDMAAKRTIDLATLDEVVSHASGEVGVLTKLAHAVTKNKFGALIVKNSGTAAGVAGLLTLMATWLPNKKREETLPDGSVEASETWGFAKKATVAVGAILSAGLLAHYAHSAKWANKVTAEAGSVLAR